MNQHWRREAQYKGCQDIGLGSNPVTFPPEHPEVVDLCLTEDVEVEADPDEGEEAAQGPQHQGVQLQAPPI